MLMVDIFAWIFSHFSIGNLNIFYNNANWIFYHFRREKFEISENLLITMVIEWLILLPVSNLNFSNLEGESAWSFTRGDDNKNITAGGPYIVLWIYGYVRLQDWQFQNHELIKNVIWITTDTYIQVPWTPNQN